MEEEKKQKIEREKKQEKEVTDTKTEEKKQSSEKKTIEKKNVKETEKKTQPQSQKEKKKVIKLSFNDLQKQTEEKSWGDEVDDSETIIRKTEIQVENKTEKDIKKPYSQQHSNRHYYNKTDTNREFKKYDIPIPDEPPFIASFKNLSYNLKQSQIEEFFSEFKVKDINVPFDSNFNTIKGFGRVEFESKQDLINALKKNGTELEGRPIIIQVFVKKYEGEGSGFRGGENKYSSGGYHHRKEYEEKTNQKFNFDNTSNDWRKKSENYKPPPEADWENYGKKYGGGQTPSTPTEEDLGKNVSDFKLKSRYNERENWKGKPREFHQKYNRERPNRNFNPKYPNNSTSSGGETKSFSTEENIFGEGKPWEPKKELDERIEQQISDQTKGLEKVSEEGEKGFRKSEKGSGRSPKSNPQKSGKFNRNQQEKNWRSEKKEKEEKIKTQNIYEGLEEEIEN